MKCPRCNTVYVCPCKHCRDTFSKGKVVWIRHNDDTEECPKCGLRMHLDGWEDIEAKQYEEENENKK